MPTIALNRKAAARWTRPRTPGRVARLCPHGGRAGRARPYANIRPVAAGSGAATTGCCMGDSNANITQLLRAAANGERGGVDALMAAIYDDLRRLAMRHMQAERHDHTLQPTALVHEAYLKLIDQQCTSWNDRLHFFAVASRIIRRILVDHARGRSAAKRGGAAERVTMAGDEFAAPAERVDLILLDDALAELTAIDATQAQIVELRYFGGLTIDEIAESLALGKRTVDRHWQVAKAWLAFRLGSA